MAGHTCGPDFCLKIVLQYPAPVPAWLRFGTVGGDHFKQEHSGQPDAG